MIHEISFYVLVFIYTSCFILSCSKPEVIDVCVVDFTNELAFRPEFRAILSPVTEVEGSYSLEFTTRCVLEIDGFFQILSDEICPLEQNFLKIIGTPGLGGSYCADRGIMFDDHLLENYVFQYSGVIKDDRRFVFVNAFLNRDDLAESFPNWKTEYTDGGTVDGGNWGVLFDLENLSFSEFYYASR